MARVLVGVHLTDSALPLLRPLFGKTSPRLPGDLTLPHQRQRFVARVAELCLYRMDSPLADTWLQQFRSAVPGDDRVAFAAPLPFLLRRPKPEAVHA